MQGCSGGLFRLSTVAGHVCSKTICGEARFFVAPGLTEPSQVGCPEAVFRLDFLQVWKCFLCGLGRDLSGSIVSLEASGVKYALFFAFAMGFLMKCNDFNFICK